MSSRMLTALVTMSTIVVVIFLITHFGYMGAALIPVFFFSAFLISKPKRLLGLLWGVTILTPLAESFLPTIAIKLVEQTLGLGVLAVLVGDCAIRQRKIPGTQFLNWIVLLLSLLTAASAIANEVPVRSVGMYILSYLKFIWVLYYAIRFIGDDDARSVVKYSLVTFGVQIVANMVIGVATILVPSLGGFSPDTAQGTLADAHNVGYYMMAATFLLLAALRQTELRRYRRILRGMLLVALMQFFLTYTLHAYPLLLIGLVAYYIMFSQQHFSRILGSIGIGIVVVAISVIFVTKGPFADTSSRIISPHELSRIWTLTASGPKGTAYKEVFMNAAVHLRYPILGGGPGNYTSSVALLTFRPLALSPYLIPSFLSHDKILQQIAGSYLATSHTGMMAIWGELGPIGFVLFWALYIYAIIRIWNQRRKGLYRNPFRAILAESFVISAILFIFINVLIDKLALYHLTLGLWIWAGAVWNPCKPEPEKQDEEGKERKTFRETVS